jgi:GT2 family glycosyltransferase
VDLSIIIVNWNSVDYLRKCLNSIYKNVKDINQEIIVVDNASYDGCAEIMEKEFKKVKFIQCSANIGFARANNLAFEKSLGKVLLFLNPDTEVIDNAIQTMYSFLLQNRDAAIVGCKLLNTDYSMQMNCILPLPNLMNEVLDIGILKTMFYKRKIFGIQSLFEHNDQPQRVGVINGACIMIKREIFEKIDKFSTSYFMYSEDVDLAYKVKKSGYYSYFLPMVSIVHHGGKSTISKKNAFFSALLLRESRWLFFKRTKGAIYAQIYRIIFIAVSLIRIIMILILLPLSLFNKKYQKIYLTLLKWKNIFRWSIGLEKWTKDADRV